MCLCLKINISGVEALRLFCPGLYGQHCTFSLRRLRGLSLVFTFYLFLLNAHMH